MDLWASEEIFTSDDVASLNNGTKLPLVMTFDCLNGYFCHATDDYCIAEEFVRASGKGAIACWSHAGLEYTSLSEVLGAHLYAALLHDGDYILGSSIYQAKLRYLFDYPDYWDQAAMLILFGDPALEMGLPSRPDLVPGTIRFHPLRPMIGQSDTIAATLFNAGRSDASNVSMRFTIGDPESGDARSIAEVTVPNLRAGTHTVVTAVWDSIPAAGEYRIFAEADPRREIVESCEWNNAVWDTLRVQSSAEPQDTIPPMIEISIDGKRLGTGFQDNDFISSTPEFTAVLRDEGTGINIAEIEILMDGEIVDDFQLDPKQSGSKTVELTYRPQPLRDGQHKIQLRISDCSPAPNLARASVTLSVESKLVVREARSCPNPWRDQTNFLFVLSQDAREVEVSVYSVAGRLVRTLHGRGYQNRNVIGWDGGDEHGKKLASGVYFYKIAARGHNSYSEVVGKSVLIR